MNIRLSILFISLLFLANAVHAQNQKEDTTYIKKFKRVYNIQINNWLTDVDLVFSPKRVNRNVTVRLFPNVKLQSGVSLGFKRFTLAVGFQLPHTQSDEKRYGKTNYYDISFGYFQRKFGGEVYYRYFRGMMRGGNDLAAEQIRPDVFISNGGFNFFYAVNHKKFSMRSAISQQEQQRISAGSPVLLANLQFRNLRADSSIIAKPVDNANYFSMSGLTQMRYVTLNLKPGYAYNFVGASGNWFFSPSAFVGVGTGWFNNNTSDGFKKGLPLDLSFHSKNILGINHENWFASVYYIYDGSLNILKKNFMMLNTHCVGVNIGYRFNSIGIKWL